MDRTHPVRSIVAYVLRPSSTFDVDDDSGDWPHEPDRHQGTQVALRVSEREVVPGEALDRRVELDGAEVLHVGGVLPLARHPNVLPLFRSGDVADVLLEVLGHVRRKIVGVVVVVGRPAVDLVQLEEYAGRAPVVVEELVPAAVAPVLHVDLAHFRRAGQLRVRAGLEVGVALLDLTRRVVLWNGKSERGSGGRTEGNSLSRNSIMLSYQFR
jgi:hypothetical protein